MLESALKAEFIKVFHEVARLNHPHSVWSDIVHMWSFAFQNVVLKSEEIEKRYLEISEKYSKEKLSQVSKLLALVVEMLEAEPRDVLGPLYMELEIGNKNSGQFFTPPELSKAIAGLVSGADIKAQLEKEEFITLSEPACGSGGMILSYINIITQNKLDPSKKIWVSAVDVDPVVARMCHVQLSLWNVPAEVIIGNSLSLEVQEAIHTPIHHLGFWGNKIRRLIHEQKKASNHETVEVVEPESDEPINLYRAVKEGVIPYEDLGSYKEQLGLGF